MTPVVHPISNQQSASAREPSIVQPSLNHAASHHLGNASSTQYYEQVLQHNDNVSDFFRHFEAPGVGHCAGGPGPLPNAALEQLVGWVENGTAPATLDVSSAATGLRRPLYPYPPRQVFVGGEANSSASFACAPGV